MKLHIVAVALVLVSVGCRRNQPEAIDPDPPGGEPQTQAAVEVPPNDAAEPSLDDEAAIEQPIAEANAKVPNANLSVGSATVDGLTVSDLECRIDGAVGMLGSLAVIGALAQRKAKIDQCGEPGATAAIHWVASGGKISKADGEGSEGACVAKVLENLSTPLDGECAVTVVLGP